MGNDERLFDMLDLVPDPAHVAGKAGEVDGHDYTIPVIPAGRRFYIPRGRPLAVRFGHPLHFHQPRRHASHAEREEITRRIMGHIAAMLHAGRPAEARRGEAGAS